MKNLAIVIPTHNNLKYLKDCIFSLRASDPNNEFHYIVIDNASTDDTKNWLRTMTVYGKFHIITNKKNCYVNKAWNQGLTVAKKIGVKNVAFVNNDTMVQPDWWDYVGAMLDYKLCVFPAFTIGDKPFVGRIGSGMIGFFFIMQMKAFDMLEEIDGEWGFHKGYDKGLWYEDKDMWKRLVGLKDSVVISTAVIIHHFGSRTIKKIKNLDKLKEDNLKVFIGRWGFNPNEKK